MSTSRTQYISDLWREGVFGANACIVGRNEEKTRRVAAEIASLRPHSRVLGLGDVDVRNTKDMEKAVRTCIEQLGAIDFVIAGAAGNFLAPISQLSVNAFKAVVDIDLVGSFITLKATLPYLIESAKKCRAAENSFHGIGGRIIFISSTSHYTSRPMQAHGCAAKARVNALSNCVALEYGPLGITSNVLAPGPIDNTVGVEKLMSTQDRLEVIRNVPLQRMGSVEDIADATIFLSEPGSFVNGACIDVDGGAWRTKEANPGQSLQYPEYLIVINTATGPRGAKL